MVIQFHRDKFEALVHYICATCKDASKLGATKLNKILWLSDMLAYANHGAPITGETYKKDKFGPVPVHINAAVSHLQKDQKMQVQDIPFGDGSRKQKRFIAGGNINKSLFSAEQLDLVDFIRDYVCEDHTAGSISDLTHDAVWEMAQMGERIPYEAILISRIEKPTKEDIDWARSVLVK